jgi:hypothetical protein
VGRTSFLTLSQLIQSVRDRRYWAYVEGIPRVESQFNHQIAHDVSVGRVHQEKPKMAGRVNPPPFDSSTMSLGNSVHRISGGSGKSPIFSVNCGAGFWPVTQRRHMQHDSLQGADSYWVTYFTKTQRLRQPLGDGCHDWDGINEIERISRRC